MATPEDSECHLQLYSLPVPKFRLVETSRQIWQRDIPQYPRSFIGSGFPYIPGSLKGPVATTRVKRCHVLTGLRIYNGPCRIVRLAVKSPYYESVYCIHLDIPAGVTQISLLANRVGYVDEPPKDSVVIRFPKKGTSPAKFYRLKLINRQGKYDLHTGMPVKILLGRKPQVEEDAIQEGEMDEEHSKDDLQENKFKRPNALERQEFQKHLDNLEHGRKKLEEERTYFEGEKKQFREERETLINRERERLTNREQEAKRQHSKSELQRNEFEKTNADWKNEFQRQMDDLQRGQLKVEEDIKKIQSEKDKTDRLEKVVDPNGTLPSQTTLFDKECEKQPEMEPIKKTSQMQTSQPRGDSDIRASTSHDTRSKKPLETTPEKKTIQMLTSQPRGDSDIRASTSQDTLSKTPLETTPKHLDPPKIASNIINDNIKEAAIKNSLEALFEKDEKDFDRQHQQSEDDYSVAKYIYREEEKDSRANLLHLAVSHRRTSVVELLCDKVPKLISKTRDKQFNGQTPFHTAVAKSDLKLVKLMYEKQDDSILSSKADGLSLKGTIMMGETPLSIAVLRCDEKMTTFLVGKQDVVITTDTAGNTVLHTIVRYAHNFPEKDIHVKATETLLNALGEHDEVKIQKFKKLLNTPNMSGITPLQLACRLNQKKVFLHLIDLDKVNKFNHDMWDESVTYSYDITELDTVHWRQWLSEKPIHIDNDTEGENQTCTMPFSRKIQIYEKISCLQAISQLTWKSGLEFMEIEIIFELIKRKWKYYRLWFYGFLLMHLFILFVLTYRTVAKTDNFDLKKLKFGRKLDLGNSFWNAGFMIIGMAYIVQELRRKYLFRQPWFPTKSLHHSTICRLLLLMFGLALFIDAIFNFAETNNYSRFLALFFGWFSLIFFLRGIKYFCYHSMVFLEIITGDMIKFLPIMLITLAPSTAVAYESFSNTNDTTGFGTPAETAFTLFQWMNGLGDIPDVHNEQKPGLAISFFVVYVIFANIIFLQTLIALMANNIMTNVNKISLRRLQKLSIIVFFESILPACLVKGSAESETQKGSQVDKAESTDKEEHRFYLRIDRAKREDKKEHFLNILSFLRKKKDGETKDEETSVKQSVMTKNEHTCIPVPET